MTDTSRVECRICGAQVHSVQLHVRNDHPDWTIDQYKEKFPDAPLLSKMAEERVKAKLTEAAASAPVPAGTSVKRPMHEVFGFGAIPAAMGSRGGPIPVEVFSPVGEYANMIPRVDDTYVYDLECLKNCLLALDQNMPLYIWGHKGTGKTTLLLQIAAHTGRPTLRVQHTVNTEEMHIVGMWVARGGETHFELGPLAMAMKHGWHYIADEYDFAQPSVLSVYQPVLEGQPLVIKEADGPNRIIYPHENFRFSATGNTNGSGDETGLYNGTMIQNAANYDRFGIVMQVHYMKPELEKRIIMGKAGIPESHAMKIVEFGTRVREAFAGKQISDTVSSRALINAAKIGARRSCYQTGIALAFTNKLTTVDREVVNGLAQRLLGKAA